MAFSVNLKAIFIKKLPFDTEKLPFDTLFVFWKILWYNILIKQLQLKESKSVRKAAEARRQAKLAKKAAKKSK